MSLKKYKPKGAFVKLHIGVITIEIATATDAQVEQLRLERPATFDTYFEEVKASKAAEPAPEKKQ